MLSWKSGTQEGADVFAEAGLHGDGEAAVGGHVEKCAGAVGLRFLAVFLRDAALAFCDAARSIRYESITFHAILL